MGRFTQVLNEFD